jgi:hypothetical protein
MRGIYAVGRRHLTATGWWMAAVLAAGPAAVLSHLAAASLWNIRPHKQIPLSVTVPTQIRRKRRGLVVYRSALPPQDRTHHHNIP